MPKDSESATCGYLDDSACEGGKRNGSVTATTSLRIVHASPKTKTSQVTASFRRNPPACFGVIAALGAGSLVALDRSRPIAKRDEVLVTVRAIILPIQALSRGHASV
jgi:hypothetical protein